MERAMREAGVQFRLGTANDVDKIRKSIKFSLANPEGRPLRKRFQDPLLRHELMVLSRYDPRERTERILAYIEWHTRVDGTVTIRDLGGEGDPPQTGTLKRVLREFVRLLEPPSVTVKLRQDLTLWNSVFEETPGFVLEGQEFSRPHWRSVWTWSAEAERAVTQTSRFVGPRRRR